MTAELLVEVSGLTKSYRRPEGEVQVLKGIDLQIGRGETVAVVGVSGAGKSTLLHLLGGLDLPTAGRILFEGVDMAAISSNQLAELRNRRLGFVFQFHHLLPEFSALENTMMPALIAREPAPKARDRATAILTELGLPHRLSHKAGELSGGEQQRVAIARAIVLAPALLLADEPTGNLDAATGLGVENTLLDLNRSHGLTLLIVTHNERLAHRMHRVIRIADGKIEGIEQGENTAAPLGLHG